MINDSTGTMTWSNPGSSEPKITVIGLDLSLTGTGVVVVSNFDNPTILDQILIESTPKEENTPRLIGISTKVMKVIIKHKPNLVVMEGPAFGVQKSSSIFTLGELAGLVKANMHTMSQPFIIVTPSALKKWITGKGNAKKDLMLLKVYKRFGVEFSDDNLCDAYSLARYGFQFVNPSLKKRTKS
jgi:crossover junction endodeoxyribonuclease RuvC